MTQVAHINHMNNMNIIIVRNMCGGGTSAAFFLLVSNAFASDNFRQKPTTIFGTRCDKLRQIQLYA